METKSKTWLLVLIVIAAIAAVVIFAVFALQGVQNNAISMEERISTADSDVKVQEKARVDKVYNLADCVMQYDKHEAETLIAIVEGRSNECSADNVTTAINAVTESYPELKSNENYKTLMNELITIENMIAQYRENYNKTVERYNRYIRKFPNRNILDMLGYTPIAAKKLDFGAPVDAPTNLFG